MQAAMYWIQKIGHCVKFEAAAREIKLVVDRDKFDEEEKLDGCYVLKTELAKELASNEIIEQRYKDLSQVEWAFRTSKTAHLETRPIHVRLESRTRGHVFVVMLAYKIVQELAKRWTKLDITVEEGLK